MIVSFTVAYAFVEPGWASDSPEETVVLAACFVWFAYMFIVLPSTENRFGLLSRFHAEMGFAAAGLIPAFIVAFEGSLGHESHPSEIREFLFSFVFLLFVIGLAVPKLGGEHQESGELQETALATQRERVQP